ncbi:MAG: TolC family protein, partial [Myxococcales bacterium]|nr:TolC family protein [Myxococcales bacterium]
ELNGRWLVFLPTLSLSANYDIGRESIRSPDGTSWTVTFNASWPIFDFSRYGQLDTARAEEQIATLELDAAAREARFDHANAVRDLEVARARVAVAEQALEVASETRELIATQYGAGDTTSLELTEADEALFTAQVALNLAQLQRDIAIVELLYVSGQLDDRVSTW